MVLLMKKVLTLNTLSFTTITIIFIDHLMQGNYILSIFSIMQMTVIFTKFETLRINQIQNSLNIKNIFYALSKLSIKMYYFHEVNTHMDASRKFLYHKFKYINIHHSKNEEKKPFKIYFK